MNALFYLLKSGCRAKGCPSQRMLPNDFAPWQTVYTHFRKWRESGRLEQLCTRLRRAVRLLSKVPRLEVVFADKGYEGTPDGLVERCFGAVLRSGASER